MTKNEGGKAHCVDSAGVDLVPWEDVREGYDVDVVIIPSEIA